MKIFSSVILMAIVGGAVSAAEISAGPRPRLRLDPVTRTAVAEQAVKVTAAPASAAPAGEVGDESPILMKKFVVKEQAVIAREAPKQEVFEGRFTPWKGGRVKEGKLGGANYEIGFWPSLEFTKLASTAMREGGPRLNVDLLRMKW